MFILHRQRDYLHNQVIIRGIFFFRKLSFHRKCSQGYFIEVFERGNETNGCVMQEEIGFDKIQENFTHKNHSTNVYITKQD